jgi:hypothetical protein
MLARRRADDRVMATAHPAAARFTATLAASGGALGLVLAAAGAGQGAPRACTSAAGRLGACGPGSLLGAKPYVTAILIGLLLGALIAIAAVLAWREVRSAFAAFAGRAPARPAVTSAGVRRASGHRGGLAPRARH